MGCLSLEENSYDKVNEKGLGPGSDVKGVKFKVASLNHSNYFQQTHNYKVIISS